MKKYNKDQIKNIRTLVEGGKHYKAVAAELGMPTSTVYYLATKGRLRKKRRTLKTKTTAPVVKHSRPDVEASFDLIADLVFTRVETRILKRFSKAFGAV
jgi:transposase